MKSKDPEFKLAKAEQFYVKKKYVYAQMLFEDVMPFFKTKKEFEDIYYKYAYCAYYLQDYLNAENLFKTYLEIFPNGVHSEEIEYMRAYTFWKQSPKPTLDQTNTLKAMGMMQTFVNTHPNSSRVEEAKQIIEESRQKLEIKDAGSAKLYYDREQFRAAAVTYTTVLNSYPDSELADEYKLMIIKSYYQFAEKSVPGKREERYKQVVTECNEFVDRFPDSKFMKEVERYLSLSQTNINAITQK